LWARRGWQAGDGGVRLPWLGAPRRRSPGPSAGPNPDFSTPIDSAWQDVRLLARHEHSRAILCHGLAWDASVHSGPPERGRGTASPAAPRGRRGFSGTMFPFLREAASHRCGNIFTSLSARRGRPPAKAGVGCSLQQWTERLFSAVPGGGDRRGNRGRAEHNGHCPMGPKTHGPWCN
jgi:hypothetical protein